MTYSRRLYENPLWIIREYILNDRTLSSMAKECKICTGTMSRWVNKFNLSKVQKKNPKYKNYDWMYNKYITEDKTAQEIADELGMYINTIRRWLGSGHLNILKVVKDHW